MITDIHTYARKGLEAELARLDAERERVRALLASLGGAMVTDSLAAPTKRLRKMSEAGRQAIREAVKRRWARVRAAAAASAGGAGGKTQRANAVATQKRTPRATRTGNRKK